MRQNSISIIEFQSIFYYLLWRRILNIIPLPYVKVFTNNKGDIEVLCNLNNAPELECALLASYLTNHTITPDQNLSLVPSNGTTTISEVLTEDEGYERALDLYTAPVNAEFRICKDFEGRLSCQWPEEAHSEIIKAAIMRKAVKALDNAINRRLDMKS
jgi:hypothetical protein